MVEVRWTRHELLLLLRVASPVPDVLSVSWSHIFGDKLPEHTHRLAGAAHFDRTCFRCDCSFRTTRGASCEVVSPTVCNHYPGRVLTVVGNSPHDATEGDDEMNVEH
uniref:Putative secreted peptide n=1 Tax=Anopheles braziliensis TaxID=58242 RepID=A0A2M3ZXD4_9DIPT